MVDLDYICTHIKKIVECEWIPKESSGVVGIPQLPPSLPTVRDSEEKTRQRGRRFQWKPLTDTVEFARPEYSTEYKPYIINH